MSAVEDFAGELLAIREVLCSAGYQVDAAAHGGILAAVREALRWGEVDRDTSKSLARRLVALGGDIENGTGEDATEGGGA